MKSKQSFFKIFYLLLWIKGFPGGAVIKNMPANTGDAGDVGSVPGLGRSPEGGNVNHSSILAWEIPYPNVQRSLAGCNLQGQKRVRHD